MDKTDNDEKVDVMRWLKDNGYEIRYRCGSRPKHLREDGCYMLDIVDDENGIKEAVYDFVPDENREYSGYRKRHRKRYKN